MEGERRRREGEEKEKRKERGNVREGKGEKSCPLNLRRLATPLLGLPSANKQSPILMHLEYKVQLSDRDWVIAGRHKLIPSIYAACTVKSDSVSYSGPTAIYIRSGKHDSSSAATHAANFEALKTVPAFQSVMCTDEGMLKPVAIITADGGPDENQRFPKTLAAAYRTFSENNLEAMFVAVERGMAPLSRDLSGLILPHDYYGSHLGYSMSLYLNIFAQF